MFLLQVTNCKHEFHLQCVLEWYSLNLLKKNLILKLVAFNNFKDVFNAQKSYIFMADMLFLSCEVNDNYLLNLRSFLGLIIIALVNRLIAYPSEHLTFLSSLNEI